MAVCVVLPWHSVDPQPGFKSIQPEKYGRLMRSKYEKEFTERAKWQGNRQLNTCRSDSTMAAIL